MSASYDINKAFEILMNKHKEAKDDILICKFEVYESLEWELEAGEAVEAMISNGQKVDGNMRCYLKN